MVSNNGIVVAGPTRGKILSSVLESLHIIMIRNVHVMFAGSYSFRFYTQMYS